MAKKHNSAQFRILLSAVSSRPIKKLADFKTTYTVPKEINSATKRFVHSCAVTDISIELEAVWNLCREEFKYKRKDKNGPLIEDGIGAISFPDFRFSVHVEQDPDDPRYVNWVRSVDDVKDLQLLLSPAFNKVFAKQFNRLEIALPDSPSIEDIIDRIEALESKEITVKYPSDCSSCEVFLKKAHLSIYFDAFICRITMPNCPAPRLLLEKIMEIQQLLRNPNSQDSPILFLE
jgi:hypothetical protein